jgi:replicative DNA helicase
MLTTLQTGQRIPPHNVEAEESVLGAMLLSEPSISNVLENLRSDDFYRPAHRKIFDAVVSLYGRGEPVDPVTVADELRRTAALEDVGGKPYLFHLVNSVPAASNAAYYAKIVEETALLRRLIEASQEAAALAYESSDDVDHVVDQVEALVFGVAQRRLGDRFAHIRDLLHDHLEQVEALQLRGSHVTGVPTGFVDLDKLTSGLQASNLIIVAARPSFGKTSFALNIAQYAATEHQVPVAIFSLEMSKMELVQRLVCSEALVDVHKLRTGTLTDQDWSRLGQAVGRLADAPIYIDDTEAVTVLEIRAKARRLKQKSGLGLVIVDYLQLMSGPRRAENRQQEISEISRSLKILARELELPVMAVSQLSRAVEQRADKHPMLADLRECVTGDTLVVLADGRRVPIGGLVGCTPDVLAVSERGRVVKARSDKVWRVGIRPTFAVRLASGRLVRATARHRLRSAGGWSRVGRLQPGDMVALASEPRDQTPYATGDLDWDRIVSIDPAGEADVFDLTVPGPASWLADGVVSHNSGAIEQDSDVVMFIYRDEVYNPDTTDKGTAEVLLAKHRNGPVGKLRLTFLENYTKFANFSGTLGR